MGRNSNIRVRRESDDEDANSSGSSSSSHSAGNGKSKNKGVKKADEPRKWDASKVRFVSNFATNSAEFASNTGFIWPVVLDGQDASDEPEEVKVTHIALVQEKNEDVYVVFSGTKEHVMSTDHYRFRFKIVEDDNEETNDEDLLVSILDEMPTDFRNLVDRASHKKNRQVTVEVTGHDKETYEAEEFTFTLELGAPPAVYDSAVRAATNALNYEDIFHKRTEQVDPVKSRDWLVPVEKGLVSLVRAKDQPGALGTWANQEVNSVVASSFQVTGKGGEKVTTSYMVREMSFHDDYVLVKLRANQKAARQVWLAFKVKYSDKARDANVFLGSGSFDDFFHIDTDRDNYIYRNYNTIVVMFGKSTHVPKIFSGMLKGERSEVYNPEMLGLYVGYGGETGKLADRNAATVYRAMSANADDAKNHQLLASNDVTVGQLRSAIDGLVSRMAKFEQDHKKDNARSVGFLYYAGPANKKSEDSYELVLADGVMDEAEFKRRLVDKLPQNAMLYVAMDTDVDEMVLNISPKDTDKRDVDQKPWVYCLSAVIKNKAKASTKVSPFTTLLLDHIPRDEKWKELKSTMNEKLEAYNQEVRFSTNYPCSNIEDLQAFDKISIRPT